MGDSQIYGVKSLVFGLFQGPPVAVEGIRLRIVEGATGRLRVPVASLAEAAAGGSRWAAISSDVVVARNVDTKTKT